MRKREKYFFEDILREIEYKFFLYHHRGCDLEEEGKKEKKKEKKGKEKKPILGRTFPQYFTFKEYLMAVNSSSKSLGTTWTRSFNSTN